MPNFRNCQNCYSAKPLARLGQYLCSDCEEAANQATEYATREGGDASMARKNALLSRAPRPFDNKHPSMHFERFSTYAMDKREAIERGSLEDPTRGGFLKGR